MVAVFYAALLALAALPGRLSVSREFRDEDDIDEWYREEREE